MFVPNGRSVLIFVTVDFQIFFKLSYSQYEFRFKIFIPLITRQVYEMIGFNGEIPSVSIQTEAFPLLKMPEGVNSSIIEPQTTQVRTKTSFDISPDGKSLMIIETRWAHFRFISDLKYR